MSAFFRIGFYIVAIVQFFAVWSGTEFFIGAESWIGRGFAFLVALFLTTIPLVGSGVGVYGAVNVWDWALGKSLLLFFWYVPIVLLLFGFSAISGRK